MSHADTANTVSKVHFSHDSFYAETSFLLDLSCSTPDTKIYYTLDEQRPSPDNENPYRSPIQISSTVTVRAIAVREGWLPSPLETKTYIFVDDIVRQPVLSGASTPSRLYDNLAKALVALPCVSIVTSAPLSETENEISLTMLWPDGHPGFQVQCGAEYFGGHSLGYPKKSIRLSFKSTYGPSRLTYDLFDGQAVDEFDQLLLRSASHDGVFYENGTKGIFIRNRWIMDRQLDMGHLAPHGRYVHVLINGIYWGIYHLMERPNAAFMASYCGNSKEDYDALNKGNPIDGDLVAWNELKTSLNNDSDLQQNMDVTNFVDYLLLQFYGGNNWDWRARQNWMAAGSKTDPHQFQFFAWDNDMILRRDLDANVIHRDGPDYLWRDLRTAAPPQLKQVMADRAQKHFFDNGLLTPQRVLEQFQKLSQQIEPGLLAEIQRWGANYGYTLNSWYADLNRVRREIIPQRTDIVIEQLRQAGWFPTIDAPTLEINEQSIADHTITIGDHLHFDSFQGDIFYTLDGSDPQVIHDDNLHTIPWITEQYPKTAWVPDGPVESRWYTDLHYNDTHWLIGHTGIGYERGSGYQAWFDVDVLDTMSGKQTSCYIRIPFNIPQIPSEGRLTLSIMADDGFVAYLNGTEVQRSGFNGTPVWNSSADQAIEVSHRTEYDISTFLPQLKAGDNLLAIHGFNASLNSSDFLIWPVLYYTKMNSQTADDVSLSAIHYTDPMVLRKNTHVKARVKHEDQWSALREAFLTIGPIAEALRFTEIMYHPATEAKSEFLELTNISSTKISLHQLRLQGGVDFDFPDVDLHPGEVVLLVRDIKTFTSIYGTGYTILGEYQGALSNGGETLQISSPIGDPVLSIRYNDQWYPATDGQGCSLEWIDPHDNSQQSFTNHKQWQVSDHELGTPGYHTP